MLFVDIHIVRAVPFVAPLYEDVGNLLAVRRGPSPYIVDVFKEGIGAPCILYLSKEDLSVVEENGLVIGLEGWAPFSAGSKGQAEERDNNT